MEKKLIRKNYGVLETSLIVLGIFSFVILIALFSNFDQQGIFDRQNFIDFLTGRQPLFASPVDQTGLIAH